MTEIAVLKEQLSDIKNDLSEIVKGYKTQWDRIDEHGREIVRLDTKIKVFVGAIMVFGPFIGGLVSAIVAKAVH